MDIILVGIGGVFGSTARYILGKAITQKARSTFPLGTFIINITGAILLGLVTGFNPGSDIRLLFADGFLGAYTTFSTFMYEGFSLFRDNEKKNAFVYIIVTLVLGIIGFIIGSGLASFFAA